MPQLPQLYSLGRAVNALPEDCVYRDGLLETMRCQRGCLPLWALHRQRLQRSGRVNAVDLDRIEAFLLAVAANCPEDAAKMRLRCGAVEGRWQWDLSLLSLESTPELEQGVMLFPCSTRLRTLNTANPGCKSLLRTGYNRAKDELPVIGLCDGLMRDTAGRVIESLRCNLLVWLGDGWVTPNLGRCGVRGVMRDWLADRVPLQEVDMDLESLCAGMEVALCNSVRGVMPVRELIGHCRWSIGPETRRLQQLITERLW
ncbi:aminotransferase class IV [Microbulbifer taiwanensis]|uniref:Aminotransferase class IV n=1 Tax=Microbulbifer taiwanensis TaxID=986746 RepID=A0ABW1YG49_9GAMM|nr:aminotransferase class IV [Microbulbifer taiwanensis]